MAIGRRDPQSYGAQGFVNGDRNIDMPMPGGRASPFADAMRGRPLPDRVDPRQNRVIRGQQPAGTPTGPLFPPPPTVTPPPGQSEGDGQKSWSWGGGWVPPVVQKAVQQMVGTPDPAMPSTGGRSSGTPFSLNPAYAGKALNPAPSARPGAPVLPRPGFVGGAAGQGGPSMAQATGASAGRRQPDLKSSMGMSIRDKYAAALGGK